MKTYQSGPPERLILLALVTLLGATGCSDSTDGSKDDAGGGDGDSAAGDGDGDSAAGDGDGDSVWMPRDAGPRGGDAVLRGDYTEQCTLLLSFRDSEALPVCSEDTRGCVESCDPNMDGCTDACIDADASANGDGLDCSGCVFTGLFQCFADQGCATEVNNFLCCYEQECLGGAPDCGERVCGERLTGAIQCGLQRATGCLDPLGEGSSDCFPDADVDAGL